MPTAWRITKRKHLRTAFTGQGARLYGGRWNSPGTALVYVAQSQALAVLEILVHLDAPALLGSYALIAVDFDDALVESIERTALPRNWTADPVPSAVQAIGDGWADSKSSAVLRVPSVLVPGESNFLLNPDHPDFRKIRIAKPIPYRFDLRFATGH